MLARVETNVGSLGHHHLEGIVECHLAILNEECHDDHCASATSRFAMHVGCVLLHVNLVMKKKHTPVRDQR